MKVIYVLHFCAILSVLAVDTPGPSQEPTQRLVSASVGTKEIVDDIDEMKQIETTNILITRHIETNSIWDIIKHFVGLGEFSMVQLTFMFALPEQDFDDNCIMQHFLEARLQRKLFKDINLTFEEVRTQVTGSKTKDSLGLERRVMLIPVLASLINDIIHNPASHSTCFKDTCRIIGLFFSTTWPLSYTKEAIVIRGQRCSIRHGNRGLKIYKYFGSFIHAMDNGNPSKKGNSIDLELAEFL
ncbi:uncharacterized protein LOC126835379 isoform X1 [Adelges cooleyi]|uniref:uncharacterized protein LOC126835379 isoform X1 n=1 Tax=Adelges cooleyi TaxID=133065 RepID=UPI00217F8544|nr:uncharacterized protein LOC126835379 isoform X1 [Adelges cooleyi]XP_050423880.1 uncharacterized protein LOC126835379 isoform X1 [Adelges cooleyi]